MSDPGSSGAPPPPGWQPPPPPPPSYAAQPAPPPYQQPPAGPWVPQRGMLGAAHKPGAMPLRPLGLGDMYDAAFRIIRFNPRATVGSAVLVAAVAWLIPIVVTALLSFTVDLSLDATGSDSDSRAIGLAGSVGSLGVAAVLTGFGTIFVTGMIAHVAAAAAVGRRLTLGQAWAATRGKRWRLVGMAFLVGAAALLLIAVYVGLWVLVVVVAGDRVLPIVLWGVLSVPVFGFVLVYAWTRAYYLAVPVLMLEPVGVLGALRRAHRLTRKQFWRTFGIALLTLFLVGVASSILGLPVGVISQLLSLAVGAKYALLVVVVTQALSQVISAAFVTPFTAAVTSLQYLDQRMRKEAYDVELMQQAGITAS